MSTPDFVRYKVDQTHFVLSSLAPSDILRHLVVGLVVGPIVVAAFNLERRSTFD